MLRATLLATAAFLASAVPAHATYSITAVDTRTRQVGGAGASCVPYEVIRIYAGVPNRGAINAQAQLNANALAEATSLLRDGADAAAVLADVTSLDRFADAPQMQWGIVDINGLAAHATGQNTLAFAGDLEDRSADGRFVFTVQGNILTSARVLEHARSAFLGGGCDLAEKLVLALEAAGSLAEGDSRCTPSIPAKSAYVDVTGSDGSLFRVSTPDVSPQDPTPLVRKAFDEYRASHPCPRNDAETEAPTRSADDSGCSCSLTRRASPFEPAWLAAWMAAAWLRRRRFARSR